MPAGRLAFVDGTGALAITGDRGGPAVSLAVEGVVFGAPAWSPDGTRIAVIGSGADATSIYIFDGRPDGSPAAKRPILIYSSSDRPPFYLYWSPDGDRVAFLATEPAGISLRMAPADGSAPLDGGGDDGIIRDGAPLYFTWEDASRLFVHVGSGAGAFAGEIDLDGTPIGPVVPGTGEFRAAGVSADGGYLAYARGDPAPGQIVVGSRDGSTSHEVPVFGPAAIAFDPTGDTLAAIAADRPAANPVPFPLGPLVLIDAGSGTARTLVAGSVLGFFWSPDGRVVAALRLAPAAGSSADSGAVSPAVANTLPLAAATPEPGVPVQLTFVDVATGEVRSNRSVRLGSEFVRTILPFFDQYALSHRVWAPDGTSIVLPLLDADGRTRAVVLGVDGGDALPIADAVIAFWAP